MSSPVSGTLSSGSSTRAKNPMPDSFQRVFFQYHKLCTCVPGKIWVLTKKKLIIIFDYCESLLLVFGKICKDDLENV